MSSDAQAVIPAAYHDVLAAMAHGPLRAVDRRIFFSHVIHE